jgi:hypothetical protein
MMEVIKKNVGVDIAKDDFVATLVVLMLNQEVVYQGSKKFNNNKKGFEDFLLWVKATFIDEHYSFHHGTNRCIL